MGFLCVQVALLLVLLSTLGAASQCPGGLFDAIPWLDSWAAAQAKPVKFENSRDGPDPRATHESTPYCVLSPCRAANFSAGLETPCQGLAGGYLVGCFDGNGKCITPFDVVTEAAVLSRTGSESDSEERIKFSLRSSLNSAVLTVVFTQTGGAESSIRVTQNGLNFDVVSVIHKCSEGCWPKPPAPTTTSETEHPPHGPTDSSPTNPSPEGNQEGSTPQPDDEHSSTPAPGAALRDLVLPLLGVVALALISYAAFLWHRNRRLNTIIKQEHSEYADDEYDGDGDSSGTEMSPRRTVIVKPRSGRVLVQ